MLELPKAGPAAIEDIKDPKFHSERQDMERHLFEIEEILFHKQKAMLFGSEPIVLEG